MRLNTGSGRAASAGLKATAVALGLSLLLVSCAGEDSSDESASETNTVQPEGSWTFVRWLKSRSDTADAAKGQAAERRWMFRPTCPGGQCDIAVTPDGANGTYFPEGYTTGEAPKPGDPGTLVWKAETGTYEELTPATISSCSTVEGTVVQDAYENTSTQSLKFTPAQNGRPPMLTGTLTQKAKGVGPGIAAKCTDYEANWTVVAAPSTAVEQNNALDFAGKYVVTEIVEATEPADQRPAGFAGILVPESTIEKSAATSGYTVKGTSTSPAALTRSPEGWSGSSTPSNAVCNLNGKEVANAFTQTETWTNLEPVVTTEDGKPVLSGRWEGKWTPTAEGTAAGCTASSNKGFVIFVPQTAV